MKVVAFLFLNRLIELAKGARHQILGDKSFGLAFTEGAGDPPTTPTGRLAPVGSVVVLIGRGRANPQTRDS